MGRIPAIDNLRGLVMVLMTLDHVRDFFSNADFSPTDLDRTTAAYFLTRWITHFCAPVFIFLAGTSAYLSGLRTSKRRLCGFLLTRGLWIIFLGVTLETLAWSFFQGDTTISGSVLWAIGWSMLFLAVLIHLPVPVITAFGCIMIAGHNAFDGVSQQSLGAFGPLWAILHTGEPFRLSEHLLFEPYYPLIPWIGVMAAGYGFGGLMTLPPSIRDQKLYRIGSITFLLFIAIRWSNYYGDPAPWSVQESGLFTLFSFINCDKYPPSLCYLLMTLGPAIALLPFMDKLPGGCARQLQIFGQTPMFFYLLHLPLVISLSLLNAWLTANFGMASFPGFPEGFPEAYGYGLPVVYLVWIIVLLMLYPLCRWFREIKRSCSCKLIKYL